MPYIHSLPNAASFTDRGLTGYTFGPLNQKDLEIYYIVTEKGHDFFMISKKITRTYYVLSGSGYFTIANTKYDVGPGMLIEVPPKVEYCYSGKMTLICFSKPRWFKGNDKATKWNPDVVDGDGSSVNDEASLLGLKILGKSPVNAYLRLNRLIWEKLPSSWVSLTPIRSYGKFLHAIARKAGVRAQAPATFFFRNRPQLELLRRLVDRRSQDHTLRVAVVACSTGAEAYSVAWTIRSARPDLTLSLRAADISSHAVEFAKTGVYSLTRTELAGTVVCERMTNQEVREVFHNNGDAVAVRPWLKEGIQWQVGDVRKAEVISSMGLQDIVIANNFLCHMRPSEAEACLRNIARLVVPGGYLFVSGIDLDIRTKVARDLNWKPVTELLEEIHEGDPCLRNHWPCLYGGLEPLEKARRDWQIRYAAVFQLGDRQTAFPVSLPGDTAFLSTEMISQ